MKKIELPKDTKNKITIIYDDSRIFNDSSSLMKYFYNFLEPYSKYVKNFHKDTLKQYRKLIPHKNEKLHIIKYYGRHVQNNLISVPAFKFLVQAHQIKKKSYRLVVIIDDYDLLIEFFKYYMLYDLILTKDFDYKYHINNQMSFKQMYALKPHQIKFYYSNSISKKIYEITAKDINFDAKFNEICDINKRINNRNILFNKFLKEYNIRHKKTAKIKGCTHYTFTSSITYSCNKIRVWFKHLAYMIYLQKCGETIRYRHFKDTKLMQELKKIDYIDFVDDNDTTKGYFVKQDTIEYMCKEYDWHFKKDLHENLIDCIGMDYFLKFQNYRNSIINKKIKK